MGDQTVPQTLSSSGNSGNANPLGFSTSTTKFIFKSIPGFNPTFYRAWAFDVQDAFAEHEWINYLIPPSDRQFEPDPRILVQSKTFLSQSIPYEHKAGIEHCKSAAEIFRSLQQRYGTSSREDELRLESQLMSTRKLGADTIDQHINKVEDLIAAIMAQQAEGKKYDDDKRNQLFLHTLQYSDIKDEDWSGFIPFLGKAWHEMSPQAVFADARMYYNMHILPKKFKSTEPHASNEPRVLATQTGNSHGNDNSNRGKSNNQGHGGKSNNYGKSNRDNYGKPSNPGNPNNNNNNHPQRQPRDPTQFCFFHGTTGHSTEACKAKFRDERYMEFLQSSQQSQQQPQQHPPLSDPPSYHHANRIGNSRIL